MFKAILRLTRQSLIYGIGQVLSKAIVIILLPVHTNKLTTDEYGIFNILLLFVGFMAIVYSFGLNTAFLQFFMIEPDRDKKDQYFSTALIATFAIVGVLSLAIFSFKAPISHLLFEDVRYKDLMNPVIGILTLDAFILLSKNILRAEEKAILYASVSLINVAVNCLLNIKFVVYDGMGVRGILLANVLASAITLAILLPITIKHFSPTISIAMLKKMLKFGLPFLPSALSILLIDAVDRKLIGRFLGMEAVGIYGAGYKVSLVIKLFINAFNVAWIPFFLSLADDEQAKNIFAKVLTYFTLICSFIFLSFTMFMDQIVRIKLFGFTIVGQQYWGSLQIVPVVMLAYIFYGFYLNFQVGIFIKHRTKYFAYINIAGAITNIAANLLLIPMFQLMGAAYATLLAYFLMALSFYFISQRIYPIQYELLKILKIGLISLIIFLNYSYIFTGYDIVFKISLVIAYLLLIYIFKIFDAKEIQTFKLLVNKFYGKISTR